MAVRLIKHQTVPGQALGPLKGFSKAPGAF